MRYRVQGIHRDASGRVVRANRIIAKVSRVEVASKFLAPPPAKFLRELVASGEITAEQAEWAGRIPMAEDVTAEADSGGHTDNQPAIVLLPTMLALRDRMQAQYRYDRPLRVGAAGGISTPWSAAAALAMGAAYLVTGSVNQACVESGTSDAVRRMLAQAQQADIAMAPAADMFEMGVKVQVLKRGTMFAMRAAKLYELYRVVRQRWTRSPPPSAATLEKNLFRAPLETIWEQTQAFFRQRDPAQIDRAERDPKHKMALVFRWYLGHVVALGQRGRAVADGRLPGLVRPGDGRVQRLGPRLVPGAAREPPRGDRRAEYPLRRGRPAPRPRRWPRRACRSPPAPRGWPRSSSRSWKTASTRDVRHHDLDRRFPTRAGPTVADGRPARP